jgi:hypothetical protein
MANDIRPQGQGARNPRKTLRLTFRVTGGDVRLESCVRLDMICPPSVGERPEAGRHCGFWMQLQDAHGRVLFHRLLHAPLGHSVEVHSPDGKIQRVFGAPADTVFEVLVPDDPDAVSIVMMGEVLDAKTGRAKEGGSRELKRFDIPKGDTGTGVGDERK